MAKREQFLTSMKEYNGTPYYSFLSLTLTYIDKESFMETTGFIENRDDPGWLAIVNLT